LAKLLKGRTDNAIKNHWNATLSRKLNNPAENFRNQFIERGVSLEWLLAHPELDTSNDIEEALAARNYNSKVRSIDIAIPPSFLPCDKYSSQCGRAVQHCSAQLKWPALLSCTLCCLHDRHVHTAAALCCAHYSSTNCAACQCAPCDLTSCCVFCRPPYCTVGLQIGLAALKGIKKKKRRSTPDSPSYSDGMTPTAVSSRPSKFQAISKKQSALEPSAESGLTGKTQCMQPGWMSMLSYPCVAVSSQQLRQSGLEPSSGSA
jgi:hypothetical protein